jgi:hypothetical protein
MDSENPADWDRAWDEALEPLNRLYPDHAYQEEVEKFRQQIDDHSALKRALRGLKVRGPMSEAQRFYQRGLRLCQEGDAEGARRVWQNVVNAFGAVENEKRWVQRAQQALQELERKIPEGEDRRDAVSNAWNRAQQQPRGQAEKAERALEALYYDDDVATKKLRELKQARDAHK